jgi:outer membrane protein OmpA-like peptidoglycan-associated protein
MPPDSFSVAPTTDGAAHNLLRAPLQPIAIWELVDAHFAFDSSVLLPSMTADLANLIAIVRANPASLLSVFGHADTTGNDDYNKVLAGRRAMALYALLTRRVDLWEFLFTNAHGGDNWRRDGDFALFLMRRAVKDEDASLPRHTLFDRFMSVLSTGPDGKPFGMPKTAFLGKGRDANGKADFQGCGEFNPLIMFSAAEARTFKAPEQKDARDAAGAPNRRVVVYFFPPSTVVDPAKWPCPRALEGTAGCRKRFWSDASVRRTAQANHRTIDVDKDTFACRFYDRLANERARETSVAHFVEVVVHDEKGAVLPNQQMILIRADGVRVPAVSGADGVARWVGLPLGKAEVGFADDTHFPEPEVPDLVLPEAPPAPSLSTEPADPTASTGEEGSDKAGLDASAVAEGRVQSGLV